MHVTVIHGCLRHDEVHVTIAYRYRGTTPDIEDAVGLKMNMYFIMTASSMFWELE